MAIEIVGRFPATNLIRGLIARVQLAPGVGSWREGAKAGTAKDAALSPPASTESTAASTGRARMHLCARAVYLPPQTQLLTLLLSCLLEVGSLLGPRSKLRKSTRTEKLGRDIQATTTHDLARLPLCGQGPERSVAIRVHRRLCEAILAATVVLFIPAVTPSAEIASTRCEIGMPTATSKGGLRTALLQQRHIVSPALGCGGANVRTRVLIIAPVYSRALWHGTGSNPHIRLSYLDHPFWRGECLRISLTMSGVAFADDRLSWNALCEKGWYPGCMPVLEADGQLVGMTPEIATYVGKLTGYYPRDDAGVEAFNLVFRILTDITDVLTGIQERDPQRKIAARQALVAPDGLVSQALSQLEMQLRQHAQHATPFLAGDSFSVADLAAWRACGWLSSGILDGVPTDLIASQFPALQQHHLQINSMPDVQSWMKAHPSNYRYLN